MEAEIWRFYAGALLLVFAGFAGERWIKGRSWIILSIVLGGFGFSVWGVTLHTIFGFPKTILWEATIIGISLAFGLMLAVLAQNQKD